MKVLDAISTDDEKETCQQLNHLALISRTSGLVVHVGLFLGAMVRAGYEPTKAQWMLASAVRWCRCPIDTLEPIRTELSWYAGKLRPSDEIPCRPDIEEMPLAPSMVPCVRYWHGIPIVTASNDDAEQMEGV